MAAVLRQSFAWWSFTWGRGDVDAAGLFGAAATIGYEGVEMVPESLRPVAADAGLAVVTVACADSTTGFNDPRNHAALGDEVRRLLTIGVPNVIVFSGNRHGADDEAGVAHCVDGLEPLAEEAEAAGVTLLLELLNSKVDHPGYQCDSTDFGVAVVEKVDSPALRLLYDGYHMQVMEGDLSRTIKAHLPLIGHVHTGGVPGRRDLDDRQEVNWRAIGGLLRHLDYQGWVGHEFVPRHDPVDSLRAAYEVMAG